MGESGDQSVTNPGVIGAIFAHLCGTTRFQPGPNRYERSWCATPEQSGVRPISKRSIGSKSSTIEADWGDSSGGLEPGSGYTSLSQSGRNRYSCELAGVFRLAGSTEDGNINIFKAII